MTHFTHTGILAGTPMCTVSRRQAQEHGDQLQHPAYSKAGYEAQMASPMNLVPAEAGATCEYRECGMDAVVCDLNTVSDGEVSFYCAEHRPYEPDPTVRHDTDEERADSLEVWREHQEMHS